MQSLYFSFCHPFKFAAYLGDTDFLSSQERREWPAMGIRPLDVSEAIALSWVFKIISAILVFVILNSQEYFLLAHPLLKVRLPSLGIIIFLGLSVAFFPFKLLILVTLWKWAIRVFAGLYLEQEEIENHLDHVLAHSLSTNVMVAIPFLGPIFQQLLWGLYLFAGLKNTYQLGAVQAFSIFSLFIGLSLLMLLAGFLAIVLLFKLFIF